MRDGLTVTRSLRSTPESASACSKAGTARGYCFTGYFAACGKSYIGFLHNIIAIVLVRVPGSYLASRLFAGTLLPMGLAAPAGSLLSVMICVAAYRWMKRRGTLYTAA